jgi:hypothetical protein
MMKQMKLSEGVSLFYTLRDRCIGDEILRDDKNVVKAFYPKFLYSRDRTVEHLIKVFAPNTKFKEICEWQENHAVEPEKKEKKKVDKNKSEKTIIYVTKAEWDKKNEEYQTLCNELIDVDIFQCKIEYLPKMEERDYYALINYGFILIE